MQIESSVLSENLGVVVTRADGSVKDTRFVKSLFNIRFEFIPNQFYLKLINSGRIQVNKWKVPFLFGQWNAKKEIS